MSNAVVKLMFIAVLSISSIRSITVRNGAYHNIVIEIDREVPVDDCSNFLLNLEVNILGCFRMSFIQLET